MPDSQSAQQDDQMMSSPAVVQPVVGDAAVLGDTTALGDVAAVGDQTIGAAGVEPGQADEALGAAESDSVAPVAETVAMSEEPIVDAVDMNKPQTIIDSADNAKAIQEIVTKLEEVQNVLVALSNNPSADEIAAAIGLTIALDKMGKRATAIYSGETPNVLQFLEPQKTLADNPDVLQDLIIALNKDKADHLRYKVDGDYVKIFITPYNAKLTQDDLSYSYGDYNVDLVIALDVHTAVDLDAVLREHGRIMHDASAVNITTGAPGRFADMEWSNATMSSVSEMVTDLLLAEKELELDAEVATPLLAGIVAATERFKNEHTTPETMRVAGRLMEAGANAQLIAENVTNEAEPEGPVTDLNIEVEHSEEAPVEEVPPEPVEEVEPEPVPAGPVDAPVLNAELMEELKRQKEEANKPPVEEAPKESVKDYGRMIDEALAEINAAAPAEPTMETETPAAGEAGAPVEEAPVSEVPAETPEMGTAPMVSEPVNEAQVEPTMEAVTEPVAETTPVDEAQVVPQAEVAPELPMPDSSILPPPPAPEVDFSGAMPAESEPVSGPVPVGGESVGEPAPVEASADLAAASVASEPAGPADPSEFKIPGM